MKKILLAFVVLLTILSCKESEIMTWDASDFIFFARNDSQIPVRWDTIRDFNFFIDAPGASSAIFRLPVQRGGFATEDQEYLIDVEVINGVEGVDFDVDRRQIMRANRRVDSIRITCYNTSELQDNPVSLIIHLRENENFTLNLPFIYHNGDTLDRTRMPFEIKNKLDIPTYWRTSGYLYIGYFSEAKYLLFNDLFDMTFDDWRPSSEGGTNRVQANFRQLFTAFSNFINRQIAKGYETVLEEGIIVDMDPQSDRGYMWVPNTYSSTVPGALIPAHFPTVPGWVGPQ